ncbi:hypothetical protein [Pedobacter sp. UBA5917]|jgi:hypothetical protein|uniref:hypothetical protein n=1 Tax=Pedobacter sp. UBA5917 TaxID=1947061 RepID=UPI0025CC571B|nr:hypothetical protein [Pedobacter sp. UBA5917]
MQKLKLYYEKFKKYEVEELSLTEMKSIEGGSWFCRAFEPIGNALDDAYHWVQDNLGITLGSDGLHGK